jgi:hypothetical protein
MKKYLILSTICFSFSTLALSQSVGIGTTVPNGSAQLDITSTAKGILIPRMSTSAISSIINPAKGLLVYDSVKNQLMVNMGSPITPDWETIVAKSGWNLTGNSGTSPATDFIGTTDATPFIIKVNNVKAGFVDSGTNNTGFGFRTLDGITTGTDNLAFGYKALASNSTGLGNTAIGSYALPVSTTGSYNAASGSGALQNNSTGDLNAAFGTLSLNKNIVGAQNTAIGTSSLYWNTASNNTGVGFESLNQNTAGGGNTAIGTSALWNNTQGYSNVAIGVRSLYLNVDAANLVAVGDSSLFNNGVNGVLNTAIGSKSLFSNTAGYLNTANGYQALYSNTTGGRNTAVGFDALHNNSTGNYNTAIGSDALSSTSSSSLNTVLGADAGGGVRNLGSDNTFIGAESNMSIDGRINCIGLGEAATCTANNQARIGNSSTTSIGGQVGWTTISDGRYKKNIQENVKGIDFIMKLRPVTYQLDVQEISTKLDEGRGKEINEPMKNSMSEKEKTIFSGFVAQEVEKAAKESGYDFSGVDAPKNENDFYGLRYGDFVVPLVKTVQEQQFIIQQQQVMIEELKIKAQKIDQQQQQINDLLKDIQLIKEKLR